MAEVWTDVGPWHCGLCGAVASDCNCGEPLALVVKVPGMTSDMDPDAVASELIELWNERYGFDDHGQRRRPRLRLLAAGWADAGATGATEAPVQDG